MRIAAKRKACQVSSIWDLLAPCTGPTTDSHTISDLTYTVEDQLKKHWIVAQPDIHNLGQVVVARSLVMCDVNHVTAEGFFGEVL